MSGVRVGNDVVEVVDNRIQAFGSGGTGVGIDNPSNNNTTLRGNYGRTSNSSAAWLRNGSGSGAFYVVANVLANGNGGTDPATIYDFSSAATMAAADDLVVP